MVSYISKYLVHYVAVTPKTKPAAATQRVSDARVLTSPQCVAILKEREEQKKKEQEEKEKRKSEREQRNKRENAMKKKAEEWGKKATEKAKKAEELAKMREMRSQKEEDGCIFNCWACTKEDNNDVKSNKNY